MLLPPSCPPPLRRMVCRLFRSRIPERLHCHRAAYARLPRTAAARHRSAFPCPRQRENRRPAPAFSPSPAWPRTVSSARAAAFIAASPSGARCRLGDDATLLSERRLYAGTITWQPRSRFTPTPCSERTALATARRTGGTSRCRSSGMSRSATIARSAPARRLIAAPCANARGRRDQDR